MDQEMQMYKPFALGRIRAEWMLVRGCRVLRISGGVKQRKGHKGIEMSPYESKALAEWIASTSSGEANDA
jgi:hypothetical protein